MKFCVYPCLKIKKFQCKIRDIFVIMKNYKSLFAKEFDLGNNFNFVKSFLANVLVIITLAALFQFSPKFIVNLLPKSVFLLLIRVHLNF